MKNFKLIACVIVIFCMIMCSGCGDRGVADLAAGTEATADSVTAMENNPDTEVAEQETFSLPAWYEFWREFNEVLNSADKLKGSENIFHLYDVDIDAEDELINIESCIINNESRTDETKLVMAAVFRKESGEDSGEYARLYIIDMLSGKIECCSDAYDIPRYYPQYMKLEAKGDYIILYTFGEDDRFAYYFDDTLRLCKDIRAGVYCAPIRTGFENNDITCPIIDTVTIKDTGYSSVKKMYGFLLNGELVYVDEPKLGSDNWEQVEHTGFILEDCFVAYFICGGNYLAVSPLEEDACIIYDTSSFEEVYRLDSELNILSSYEHTIAVSTDTPFKYFLIHLDTGNAYECFYNEPIVKFDLANDCVYTESRENDTGIVRFRTYRYGEDMSETSGVEGLSYWYGYSQNDNDIFCSLHDTTYEVRLYDTRLALNYDSESSQVEIYALYERGFGGSYYEDTRCTEEYNDLNMIAYEHYIEIYYGDEEFACLPDDYTYKKCEDLAYVGCILSMIKNELALYPEEIFRKRYGIKGEKLKIVLSEGPLKENNGVIIEGFYTSDKIVIDISSANVRGTLHHEIWHALEDCGKSMYEVSPLYHTYSWNAHNPDDFSYQQKEWKDYDEYTVLAGSEYFINRYAKKSQKEDRASIFAAAMTGEGNIKETLAVMQPIAGKIECMEEFLQYVYGCAPYSVSFINGINSESEQPN